MQNKQLEAVVDTICQRGCRYVNSVLEDQDTRSDCVELKALNSTDQHEVLHELKAVMSVYEQTGSCEI